jgi:hypothetical protein
LVDLGLQVFEFIGNDPVHPDVEVFDLHVDVDDFASDASTQVL